MRILNIRHGFAINSSSTHSIIVMDDPSKVHTDECCDKYQYGWEEFVLADREAKLGYLAAMLYEAMHPVDFGVIKAETGQDVSDIKFGPYIDHQSVIDLPVHASGKVHLGFFRALRDWLLSDDITILGGNDNEDRTLPHMGKRIEKLNILRDTGRGAHYCRKERITQDGVTREGWSLFNPETGNRVLLSFDDHFSKSLPFKGKLDRPMLVDLCITHYCNKHCPYCYMNATEKGKHADFDYIKAVIDALAELEVYEVALGGGEPTYHPHFWDIIKYCANKGVVPNFSTKQLGWMKTMPKGAMDDVGAFAFSYDCCGKRISQFYDTCVKYGIPKNKMAIQYVLGTGWKVEHAVAQAWRYGLPITLLGQKRVGRGREWFIGDLVKRDNDWFLTIPKLYECMDAVGIGPLLLGVDTTIVQQFREEVAKMQPSPLYYTDKEGDMSCAIDAVNKTIAASSYDEKVSVLGDSFTPQKIKQIFATF